ncbi:MAG: DNA/RNA non-specific endonuclease [Bacteroidales bacterium]|nr:DNA/RNA non-specific endonuclease [Bacteroidales bacterium]
MLRKPLPRILTAFVLLAASSCDKQDEPVLDTDAAISVRKASLEAEAGSVFVSVTARGDWSISLEYASGSGWASVDPDSGSGSKADIRLRYAANEGASSRRLTLVLKPVNGYEARVSVEQEGTTPSAGGFGADVAKVGWLEIPATKAGDGREFFTHDMKGGRYISESVSGTRNWSFYWDYAEHLSVWVAYPLNRKLIGSGTRSNAWGLDPLIADGSQPNVSTGSYGGGWTRGHQIPSADRLTRAANVSTFYGTNMTPQDYDFNAHIWAELENKVRKYADSSDTLYVVTGCLVDKDSDQYSGSNYGFQVHIPTHYFKALLWYRANTTYGIGGYMAAGFLLPHDSSIAFGNYLDYLMSVDELEERTGIDFFPNLSGVAGRDAADRVEAEVPGSWWK